MTTPSTSSWPSWPGHRSGMPPSLARPPRSSPTCQRPGRRTCRLSLTCSASANMNRSSPAPTGWFLSAALTWSDISNEAKRSTSPWLARPPAARRPRRAASVPQQRNVIPVRPRDSRQALDPDPDQGQVRSRTIPGAVPAIGDSVSLRGAAAAWLCSGEQVADRGGEDADHASGRSGQPGPDRSRRGWGLTENLRLPVNVNLWVNINLEVK
jgi:hypothetical protein